MASLCKCGRPVKTVRGDYLFAECGLNNVLLRGVKLLHCEACGSTTPLLSKVNHLLRVIALALILKPSVLTGSEIRYLRKYVGLTGEQFGNKLGLTKEHISRIENNKYPVGEQTERLIRFVAVSADPDLASAVQQLFELMGEIGQAQQERIEINLETGSFKYAAA